MTSDSTIRVNRHRLLIIFGILLLALVSIGAIGTSLADDSAANASDLVTSVKEVSAADAKPGDTLHYNILLRNTGDVWAEVSMTDTLPVEINYVTDTLSVENNEGSYGVAGNVITWTGTLNNNQEFTIQFDAKVDESATNSTVISNTVEIAGNGQYFERSAATNIFTATGESLMYMPIIYKAASSPNLFLLSPTNKDNKRTVAWTTSDNDSLPAGYVLEADDNANFSSPEVWHLDKDTTSVSQTPSVSFNNLLYYRVRRDLPNPVWTWSNLLPVAGNYRDDFKNQNSNWDMRKQDTDDVDNKVFYDNGQVILRILGRWDYVLASSLAPAPEPPYRIDSKIRLTSIDNLHTYGLVFGGDWNGQPCPNNDHSSCFNHYYRLLVIWYGSSNNLKMQLKRIDYHDGNNVGRGVTLINWKDVNANKPSSGYQTWSIEVGANGQIKVLINGKVEGSAWDATYIGDRYFGGIAASNEYAGLRAEYDWFQVTSMTE